MQDLKNRYKSFAIETGVLIQQLPKSIINTAYSNQLIRVRVRQEPIIELRAEENLQQTLLTNLKLSKRN